MKSILCAILCTGLAAGLAADKPAPAGVVTALSGKVTLYSRAKAGQAGAGLKLGQQLYAGDRLLSGANGRAALVLTDGTQLRINYNTDITLRDTDSKGKAAPGRGIGSIKVALGGLWAKVVKQGSRLEFDTPSAVAAVKGTELELEVELEQTCAKLKEGALEVGNAKGSVTLAKLQMLCVGKGQKPGEAKKWDGKQDWSQEAGGASGAEVEIRYLDGGQERTLKLEYAK